MINKVDQHVANETFFLVDFFTIDERKEFFNKLSSTFCFCCGEVKGLLGECSCLEERLKECREDFLPN